MGTAEADDSWRGDDAGEWNPWGLLGLAAGACVLFILISLGLAFRTQAPTWAMASLAVLGAATVGAVGFAAVRVANRTRDEIQAKEAYAEQMRDAEALTREIVNTAGDGIITFDENWVVRSFNKAAARIFGYKPHEVVGRKVWTLISGQTSRGARLDTGEATILDEGSTVEGVRKDGKKIFLEPAISKVRASSGSVFTMVLRDLTERRRAAEALQKAGLELDRQVKERTKELRQANESLATQNAHLEALVQRFNQEQEARVKAEQERNASEARFETLVQLAPDAILIHRNDQFVLANAAAGVLFGTAPKQLEGMSISDLIEPACQERARSFLRSVLEGQKPPRPVELCIRRQTGEKVEVEASAAAIREDHTRDIQLVLRDITERRRAETGRQESERRQRALARQLLHAQESERRHIAHELHDEIGQELTALKITLQSAQRLPEANRMPLLDDCLALAGKTLERLRDLSLDLRPAALDRLGLVPSVRGLLEREGRRKDLVTHFEADVTSARFSPDLETACFRIVQEALTNVIRHARAKEVTVALRETGGVLTLAIQDDGVGFNVASAKAEALRGSSMGLLGLHERVVLAGGRLDINSRPGKGTRIDVHIPLNKTEDVKELGAPNDGSDSRAAQ